jgi:toxin ParE1/3/4
MKLRWTRRALADLDRIAARISLDKPVAAAEFVATIFDKVGRLQEFPLLGRAGAYQDTRELVVHRSSLATYRLRNDEVQVLQVWHVARKLARG